MIVSGLEGAVLVARSYATVARFRAAATRLMTSLSDPAPRMSSAR
jgi:hypothetical protein